MKPVKVLSDYQKQFIEKHFRTMTDKEIGVELGLTETWVLLYRCKNKMKKKNRKAKVVNRRDEFYFNVHKRWAWL